jgi:hypothetical protein
MQIPTRSQSKRIINLIRAVRKIATLLPGDKIKLAGEEPATYVGAIEEGDIQIDYIQLHTFTLCDGVQVVLEAPSLNRSLGRLLY